jgi:hypothetical protein
MTTLPATPPERDLSTLADEIRREAELAEQRLRDALAHAIRTGELLIEAKGQLRHGEWLPWLRVNFPNSERTASNYMRLARKSDTVADLPTVSAAIAALTEPREQRDQDDPWLGFALTAAEYEDRVKCPVCGSWVPRRVLDEAAS